MWGIAAAKASAHRLQLSIPGSKHVFIEMDQCRSQQARCGVLDGAMIASPSPRRHSIPLAFNAHGDSPCRASTASPAPLIAPACPAPAFLPHDADPDSEVCSICLEALSRGPHDGARSSPHPPTQLGTPLSPTLPPTSSDTAPPPPPPPSPPPEQVATAPCGHRFHAACITLAMAHALAARRHPQCPLCRSALPSRSAGAACAVQQAAPPPDAGLEWLVLIDAARARAGPPGRGLRVGRGYLARALLQQLLTACCAVACVACVALLVHACK